MPYPPDSHTAPDVLTRVNTELKRPPPYRVLLHNDDYTPMDFVVMILEVVFKKAEPEAVEIMLDVHKRGRGVAGVYPFAIAETKLARAHEYAEENEYPLRCSMEPA